MFLSGNAFLRTCGCFLTLPACRCRPSPRTPSPTTQWTRTPRTPTNDCPVSPTRIPLPHIVPPELPGEPWTSSLSSRTQNTIHTHNHCQGEGTVAFHVTSHLRYITFPQAVRHLHTHEALCFPRSLNLTAALLWKPYSFLRVLSVRTLLFPVRATDKRIACDEELSDSEDEGEGGRKNVASHKKGVKRARVDDDKKEGEEKKAGELIVETRGGGGGFQSGPVDEVSLWVVSPSGRDQGRREE